MFSVHQPAGIALAGFSLALCALLLPGAPVPMPRAALRPV